MSLKLQGLWTLAFLFLAKFFSIVCNGSFTHLIIYLLLSEFMIPKAPPFRSPPLLNPIFLEMLWPSTIVLAFGPFPMNSLLLSRPATHASHTRVSQCWSIEPLLLTLPEKSWESFFLKSFMSQFPGNT